MLLRLFLYIMYSSTWCGVVCTGMVPLHYATWQGVAEPVQALLHKNSPVNVQALNGETPLHLACQHGHIHVVSEMLQ